MGEVKEYILKDAKITITVHYEFNTNKGSNDFKTLQQLKLWLDDNPKIAERLGYVKKWK